MSYTQLTEEYLPENYEPEWGKLASATTESPFMEASFNLAHQCGHLTIIITSLKPTKPLVRNEAILLGITVRLMKLMKILIRDLSNNECYQQLSISREMIESAGTLEYLLQDDGSGERFDKYVNNSLVAEREVLSDVKNNIARRGGDALHIEARMTSSINSTAKAAGVDDVAQLPARRAIGFPSAEERVRELGDNAYLAYRTGSSEVHGDWADLFKYHLEYDGSTFMPYYEEPRARPQIIGGVTMIMCNAFGGYLEKYGDPEVEEAFKQILGEISDKVTRVSELHEQYLERKNPHPQ